MPVLPTGAAMEVERAAHTATRLADGRVLVTGGIRRGEAALASAEIYDPQTRAFSSTGEMTSGRWATRRRCSRTGRVLIAGGLDDDAQLRTAELYDPATGRFAPAGSLTCHAAGPPRRCCETARVLFAGGGGTTAGSSLASAELFDPQTGRFWPDGCDANRARRLRRRHACATAACCDGRKPPGSRASLSRDLQPADAAASPPRARSPSAATSTRPHFCATVGCSFSAARTSVTGTAAIAAPSCSTRAPDGSPRTGALVAAALQVPELSTITPGGAVLVAGGAQVVERFRRGRFVPVGAARHGAVLHNGDTAADGALLVVGGYDRVDHANRAQLLLPTLNNDVHLAGAVHADGEQLLDVGAAARPRHDRQRAR